MSSGIATINLTCAQVKRVGKAAIKNDPANGNTWEVKLPHKKVERCRPSCKVGMQRRRALPESASCKVGMQRRRALPESSKLQGM